MILRIILILSLFCWATQARAIVSMEDLHLGEPSRGFSGELALAVSGASGNSEKSDFSFGTRLQWHKSKHTDFVVLKRDYGKSSGEVNTDKSFFHFRHIYYHTLYRAWEGFMQGERNEFTRLRLRGLAGGGVRFLLGEKADNRALFFGAGGFREKEELAELAGLVGEETNYFWRANFYFVMKFKFGNNTKLLNSTYYQPDVQDTSDYRMLETMSLSVELVDSLSLQLSVDAVYDSQPPLGVKEADVTYRTGISYSF